MSFRARMLLLIGLFVTGLAVTQVLSAVMLATVTDVGLDAMEAAAVDHVASVRRHLIDRLTPEQIDTLGDIFITVGNGLGRQVAVA